MSKKRDASYWKTCISCLEAVEAASGFEPLNKGFADLCLTTWLRRHKDNLKIITTGHKVILLLLKKFRAQSFFSVLSVVYDIEEMERETGFEPATPTLARLYSTTELFPLGYVFILLRFFCQLKITVRVQGFGVCGFKGLNFRLATWILGPLTPFLPYPIKHLLEKLSEIVNPGPDRNKHGNPQQPQPHLVEIY